MTRSEWSMLYGGDSTGRREREREMTVNLFSDQPAFTQYHQEKEERRQGEERRGVEERREEIKRGEDTTKPG